MWAHVVVRSGCVVDQNRLLFELFGQSIDEELIRGINMREDGSVMKRNIGSENIPRRKGGGAGGWEIVSPQIGVKTLFFPFS
jgi:hypothetical protein